MSRKVRVLAVDDSAFVRRALVRMFEGSPLIEVVGVAADGKTALAQVKALSPDVVTLDVKMPGMDGLATLARLMKECPTPVVMLSSLTEGENALRALELGAVDFVDKSAVGGPMGISALQSELTAKICVAAKIDLESRTPEGEAPPPAAPPEKPASLPKAAATSVVLIGSSTGGPAALQTILAALPPHFPCPILVVQHMPLGFTAPLAERLDRICSLPVKEVEDGEPLRDGRVYLARAGSHLRVAMEGDQVLARLDRDPCGYLHVPAVDVLFETAAAVFGAGCLAVVLTGMGSDGSLGAKAVKGRGGAVIAESAETARVYGMPRAVLEAVQVDKIVPLHEVAGTIGSMI